MTRGWICLHREIQDHWIFDDAEKLRAWMIMLMTVNHKGKTSLIKGKLLDCSRGQSLMSHSSWAGKFGKNWNRSKVIRFFKLLEKDKIITQVNERVTTRVTICNYNKYQDQLKRNEHVNEQVVIHQAHTKRTGDSTQLNNDNNDNNETMKQERKTATVKPSVTLKTYLKNCEDLSVEPISLTSSPFKTAEKLGLTNEMLNLTWIKFKSYYLDTKGSNKQKDWVLHFNNALSNNWYGIWANNQDGEAFLTSKGRDAQKIYGDTE